MDLEGLGGLATAAGRRAVGLYHWFLLVVQEAVRPMIAAIIPFLITPFGRWAAIAAMVFAVWFGFARHYEKQGASRVVAQIEKRIEANAKKADVVRRSLTSVPAERLRDAYTRD